MQFLSFLDRVQSVSPYIDRFIGFCVFFFNGIFSLDLIKKNKCRDTIYIVYILGYFNDSVFTQFNYECKHVLIHNNVININISIILGHKIYTYEQNIFVL